MALRRADIQGHAAIRVQFHARDHAGYEEGVVAGVGSRDREGHARVEALPEVLYRLVYRAGGVHGYGERGEVIWWFSCVLACVYDDVCVLETQESLVRLRGRVRGKCTQVLWMTKRDWYLKGGRGMLVGPSKRRDYLCKGMGKGWPS